MAYDILIVDDEADIRALTAGILEDEGYQTREAANSTDALEAVKTRRPSLVLLDIWLQGSQMDGLGILKEIKSEHADLPVVMMSGHGTIETAVSALKIGAYDFIEKPFKTDRLILIIERAVESSRLKRENEELRVRAGSQNDLIGNSPAINTVRQSVAKVSPTNSRILISGPAGSGKEVVARLIHQQSNRTSGPFVALNCATMAPERMEEELFGVETRANGERGKVGTFEQAHNGTLFLDEVVDMPLETQGKIVRALQEQTFFRVGGEKKVEVDVRVIASTTKNLSEEIAEGRFREDLYYRLCVVPIAIPALTERREDIPVLAHHFMATTAQSIGQSARQFGDDAIAAMQAYEWPGNVRELKNLVERLLIMAPGNADDKIKAEMLSAVLEGNGGDAARIDRTGEIMSLPLREAREIFEREYLQAQVNRFGGNISRTASFIGMERSALHRKLKSLGITSDDKPGANG